MTCKCRDTDTKRCRWEFSTPDPDVRLYMHPDKGMGRAERKILDLRLTDDLLDAARDEAVLAILVCPDTGFEPAEGADMDDMTSLGEDDFDLGEAREEYYDALAALSDDAATDDVFGTLTLAEVNEIGGFTVTYGRFYS